MLEFTDGYHSYYVYIITNKYRSTYYIGMTNNLPKRLKQHKQNIKYSIWFIMRNLHGCKWPF